MLESGSPVKALAAAARNANEFKQLTGMKWTTLARDGLAMKKSGERTWQQIIMAGNTRCCFVPGSSRATPGQGSSLPGQVVGMRISPSCDELIQSVMTQAHERRKALS